jgi:hypothetical protein
MVHRDEGDIDEENGPVDGSVVTGDVGLTSAAAYIADTAVGSGCGGDSWDLTPSPTGLCTAMGANIPPSDSVVEVGVCALDLAENLNQASVEPAKHMTVRINPVTAQVPNAAAEKLYTGAPDVPPFGFVKPWNLTMSVLSTV